MASIALLQDYKDSGFLKSGPNGTAYTDPQLQAFLDRASDLMETSTYQPLRQTTNTETFNIESMHCSIDNHGILNITPRFFPLISVTSIKYRTTPATDWSAATAFVTTDYSIQEYGGQGPVIQIPFANPFWRGVWGEIQIVYVSGYAVMPKDLVDICIETTYRMVAVGLSAIETDTNQVRTLFPKDYWKDIIAPTLDKYTRKF